MKSAVTLCLLVLLCTVNATTLNHLLLRVRNAKWSVQSTIRQLMRLYNDITHKTDLAVTKNWVKQMEQHKKKLADPTLDAIRKEVEAANASGKNAQHCYDTALSDIKYIDDAAAIGARQCQDFAKCSIRNNLGFISNLVSTGRGLIEELDHIFLDCHARVDGISDILKLHSCIVNQLGISNANVKNLQKDAKSAKSKSKTASTTVIQQATDCLNNAYSNARTQVTEVREAATTCIKSL